MICPLQNVNQVIICVLHTYTAIHNYLQRYIFFATDTSFSTHFISGNIYKQHVHTAG